MKKHTMKRQFKLGSYVWTACAAGWSVIALVTGLAEAWVAAVGCGAVAGLWLIIAESY